MKYQDKCTGQIVEAIQWEGDGDSEFAVKSLVGWRLVPWEEHERSPDYICIRILGGDLYADIGEWIIKQVDGTLSVATDEYFEDNFMPAQEGQTNE